MKRLALVLCLALVPGAAAAQTVDFVLGTDSVLSILTGASRTVQLEVTGTAGVQAYNITLFLDTNRVKVAAVDTVPSGYGLPIPTASMYADSVVLSASGTGSLLSTVPIANITFSMAGGVTQGTLVSLRVNFLTLGDGITSGLPGHRTGLLDICQATSMRGDVTGERVVNSRDALVVLTAAVGLPVTGFNVAAGDADGDGQVTSRDALLILSYGIGLTTGYPDLGTGIPNVCAPLTLAPDSLVFFRGNSLYQVVKNDSTPTPLPLALAPTTTFPARWAPDGSRVLYTAYTGTFSSEVVDADATGAVVDTLTRSIYYEAGADWKPDGTQIAYVSNQTSPASVWLMGADGTNQTPLTANLTVSLSSSVAWSPDGTRIAFVAYQTCCNNGVWVINANGTGLMEVVPGSAAQSPTQVEWTTGSDSLYYEAGSQGYVRVASAVVGDTGQVAVRANGGAYQPTLSQAGRGFQSTALHPYGPYDFLLQRASDGRDLQLVRGDATNSDSYFAFRRSGGVYVDTVTVSPAGPVQLSASSSPTQQFTATVTNNDGSTSAAAVTWISRDPTKLSLTTGGLVSAVDTTAAGRYIVATAGGWRSDSVLVTVIP
jgi:Dockerin type I domain/WD40-like Beta Propeller Repeat